MERRVARELSGLAFPIFATVPPFLKGGAKKWAAARLIQSRYCCQLGERFSINAVIPSAVSQFIIFCAITSAV